MKKSLKIICSALCAAMVFPILTACDKEGKSEAESSAPEPGFSVSDVSTAPIDTNDVPAVESPLAKEEFIFGNVFFNKAVTTIELSDTTIDSFDSLIDCPYLQ
ncbi:MAG: hypothetical protein II931_01675, partial [Clostridia bacterium]|nr:hypothetical protein [Clostridia bacterium]